MAETIEILKIEVDRKASTDALVQVKQEIEALKKVEAELRKQIKETGDETGARTKQLIDTQKALREQRVQEKDLTKDLDTQSNSLKSLKNELSRLKAERDKIDTSTDVGIMKFNLLTSQIEDYNNSIKKAEEAGGDFQRSVGNYARAVEGLPKPLRDLAEGLSGMVSGIREGIKASLAFIATPLGAFLTLIAGLVATLTQYFKDNEDGQNDLRKISAVLSGVIGVLTDKLSALGKALVDLVKNYEQTAKAIGDFIKENFENRFNGLLELIPQVGKAISQLFKGEFTAAAETAANALGKAFLGVTDIVDKTKNAIKETTEAYRDFLEQIDKNADRALKIARLQEQADKLERNLIIEKSKAQRELNELKILAEQKDRFTATQRLQFLDEIDRIENELLEKEQKLLILRRDALILSNQQSNSTIEDKKAEAEAIASVIDAETARLSRQKEIEARRQALRAEALKAEEDFRKSLLKIRLDESQFEVNNIDKVLKAQLDANNKAFKDKQEKARKEAELAKFVADEEIKAVQGAAGTIAGLLEENTLAYKAAKFTENTIATSVAATKALDDLPPPANFIASAAIVAQGVANGIKILAAAGGADFVTNGPQLMLVGDNPGGRERVTVEPISGRGQTKVLAMAGGGTLIAGSNAGNLAASAEISSNIELERGLLNAVMSMPAPVVAVRDISTGLGRVSGRQKSVRLRG
jgi:DNA repair exonuclease SbcCD ATPase subunit